MVQLDLSVRNWSGLRMRVVRMTHRYQPLHSSMRFCRLRQGGYWFATRFTEKWKNKIETNVWNTNEALVYVNWTTRHCCPLINNNIQLTWSAYMYICKTQPGYTHIKSIDATCLIRLAFISILINKQLWFNNTSLRSSLYLRFVGSRIVHDENAIAASGETCNADPVKTHKLVQSTKKELRHNYRLAHDTSFISSFQTSSKIA